MLPKIADEKLKQNIKFCFKDSYSDVNKQFVVKEEDRRFFINKLGIVHRNSAFIDFYTIVAIPPAGNGDELYTLEKLMEVMNSDEYEELDGMADYIRISSIEGEGSYFLNRKTDEVFDVKWGDEEDLSAGNLSADFASFSDFLEWYYQ